MEGSVCGEGKGEGEVVEGGKAEGGRKFPSIFRGERKQGTDGFLCKREEEEEDNEDDEVTAASG